MVSCAGQALQLSLFRDIFYTFPSILVCLSNLKRLDDTVDSGITCRNQSNRFFQWIVFCNLELYFRNILQVNSESDTIRSTSIPQIQRDLVWMGGLSPDLTVRIESQICATAKPYLRIFANSEGPDQPAHPRSLLRTCTVR